MAHGRIGREACCSLADGASEDRRKNAAAMEPVPFCPPHCRAAEFFPKHFHRRCARCGRVWTAFPAALTHPSLTRHRK